MPEGIDAGELAVLRVLIDAWEPLRPELIAERLGLPLDRVDGLGERLLAVGLATWRGPGLLAPGSPDILLARLMEAHERHLVGQVRFQQSMSRALKVLGDRLASGQADAGSPPQWRVLHGRREITTALEEAAHRARREILSLHPGLPMSPSDVALDESRRWGALERGVAMRSVHLTAMMQVPHGRAHLRSLVGSGARVRIAPTLPFRLIIGDDTFAYTSSIEPGGDDAVLELRGSELVVLLREMFEFCWLDAQPVEGWGAEPVDRSLSDRELVIVRMLSEGRTDSAIARSLGVSPRTFRRLIVQVMEQLGAESRFQAGARAVELGLLSPRRGPEALAG